MRQQLSQQTFKWMAGILVATVALIGVGLPLADVSAATNTPSPSPTPSATLSNNDLVIIATIVPPSACDNIWFPCGAMPWSIPAMPTIVLPSPTVRPTMPSPTPIPLTATPTNTLTPTPSLTVTGTPPTSVPATAPNDLDTMKTMVYSVNDSLSTIQAQSTQSIMVSGTPQSVLLSATELAGNMGGLFGTIKGVQQATQSRTFGAIGFLIVCFIFVILVSLATYFLPLFLSLIKILFQAIQAIKP